MSMSRSWPSVPFLVAACALGFCAHAQAVDGLAPPPSHKLWPSLSARITIQTAAVSPLSLAGLADPGQDLRGGAVLGDYVFAQASFGRFRATSGMVFGAYGGAVGFTAGGLDAGTRLGLSLSQGSTRSLSSPSEPWQASPYLGLGFSSPAGSGGFSVSADLGWVAENSVVGAAPGRAPLGVQGSDNQRRDLRLSPLLQFGMRYAF